MKLTSSEIDRLLGGRAHLSVTEREAMLERVLENHAPERPRARWLLRWGVALAALVVATVYVGRSSLEVDLVARGATLRPSFTVACVTEGQAGRCQRGAKLAFAVSPRGYRAFAAVAEAPDGTTLWLYPSEEQGRSVALSSPDGGPITLENAVLMDGPAGAYVIHALFSPRALVREEIRSALLQPSSDYVVVQQQVELR